MKKSIIILCLISLLLFSSCATRKDETNTPELYWRSSESSNVYSITREDVIISIMDILDKNNWLDGNVVEPSKSWNFIIIDNWTNNIYPTYMEKPYIELYCTVPEAGYYTLYVDGSVHFKQGEYDPAFSLKNNINADCSSLQNGESDFFNILKILAEQALIIPAKNDILQDNSYPKNENGLTYGPDLDLDDRPILLLSTGAHDIIGYIRSDYDIGANVTNPEEAIQYMQRADELGEVAYPIYLQDGETIVDEIIVQSK